MPARIFKFFKDLLDAPAPQAGKVVGWDSNGNLAAVDTAPHPFMLMGA